MKFRVLTAVLICTSIISNSSTADNWGSWRGPTQNGICNETNIPTEWTKEKNVAWRVDLPGPAGATPVVWDDRIFLTSVDSEDKLFLMCFDTNGKEQWRHQIADDSQNVRVDEGNYASPSPVTDGKHVWTFMAGGQLACFDVEGNPVWNVNVSKEYVELDIAFGMSSTPVLHNGRLFLQLIHGDGKPNTHEAMIIALDAMTGKNIWKTGRVTGAEKENEQSYSSPMLYDFGGTTMLITHGGDFTIAYSLDDGSELWRLGGLNPHDDPDRDYHPTLRFVTSPAAADGIVVCPTAKNGPVFGVRPDSKGDLTGSDAVLWVRDKHTPDVPSPIIAGGLVYLCREDGKLLVLDQETGDEVYMKRTHNGRHRASPLLVDGHIYLTARDGKITVVKTGRKFEIVAQNEIDEVISASPIVANGTLYLRSFDALWAIREN